MTNHITVGFDGSPEAQEALRWGAGEAVKRACELEIMHCYHLPVASDVHGGWVPMEAYSGVEKAAGAHLQHAEDVINDEYPGLPVSTALRTGPAWTCLVEDPVGHQELIVVGASSHQGPSAFWLGSTPRALVRHADCPVVVVRGVSGRGGPDRVVVGTDGSEASDQALRWAAAEADLHQVGLHVVHAWEYPYLAVTTNECQARDVMHVDAALVLEQALAVARETCGSTVTGDLVEDGPASGVLGAVRDGDLLVLGSRGRGGLRAGIFGSTVNSVLDRAAIPVVVVRGQPER
jgi:nucleotide-binding universal stress UspA family protein